MILLIDVELLIGKLMIHYIITNPLFEVIIQLIVLAYLIRILNVVLKLLLVLADSREGMANFTDNIAC